MSFILDALKKSEEERRRGEVPALRDEPSSPVSRKISIWFVLLLVALLINGAMIGWWLTDRQSPAPKTEQAPTVDAAAGSALPADTEKPAVAEGQLSASAVEALPSAPSAQSTSAGADPEALADQTVEHSAEKISTGLERMEGEGRGSLDVKAVNVAALSPSSDLNDQEESAGAVASEPSLTAITASDADPSEPDFPLLGELSPDIRDGLPAMELQLHFFIDDPQRRLIRLNGINLREGDETTDGIRVVGIDADGVRLICRGRRFFLPADN